MEILSYSALILLAVLAALLIINSFLFYGLDSDALFFVPNLIYKRKYKKELKKRQKKLFSFLLWLHWHCCT